MPFLHPFLFNFRMSCNPVVIDNAVYLVAELLNIAILECSILGLDSRSAHDVHGLHGRFLVHGPLANPKKVQGKKRAQKLMKDQQKRINFQKNKRSSRKMERSSEKQDLPSPLFESFSCCNHCEMTA